MHQPDSSLPTSFPEQDEAFRQQVERLHRLTVYGRWFCVAGLWLTVGTLSLWGLRYPIELIREYFTWAAVYYGLHFQPLPTIGLATCIAFTTAVLVWQSRNILFGLPKRDRQRLERQVLRIRKQGDSHPLWKYVCQETQR
ncbi:MAG: hypothetical protein NW224_05700 [Leptolyngbyaceae cyanobacterium bins.302]|nr:hypothetical protein [Leptolyngbyaceae cyanobacterium bins.302]